MDACQTNAVSESVIEMMYTCGIAVLYCVHEDRRDLRLSL